MKLIVDAHIQVKRVTSTQPCNPMMHQLGLWGFTGGRSKYAVYSLTQISRGKLCGKPPNSRGPWFCLSLGETAMRPPLLVGLPLALLRLAYQAK